MTIARMVSGRDSAAGVGRADMAVEIEPVSVCVLTISRFCSMISCNALQAPQSNTRVPLETTTTLAQPTRSSAKSKSKTSRKKTTGVEVPAPALPTPTPVDNPPAHHAGVIASGDNRLVPTSFNNEAHAEVPPARGRLHVPTQKAANAASMALEAQAARVSVKEKRVRRAEARVQQAHIAAAVEQDGDDEQIRRLKGEYYFKAQCISYNHLSRAHLYS